MTDTLSRKTLFRFAGWFALANAVVFGLVSLRYLGTGLPGVTPLSTVYLVTVYIGHHVLLTVVPLLLLATPLILVWPRRRVLSVAGAVLFALLLALIVLDSLLWSQSRFHINALTLRILGWQSWVFVGFIFLIGLFFESMLARGTWNFVLAPKRRPGRMVGFFCGLMIVVSQLIHAWADAAYYVPVTGLGQVLPVYRGVTAKSLLADTGLVDVEASRERELARRVSAGMEDTSGRLLDYPKQPLQCDPATPLNLLMIVVDSMRGSMLTPEYAPGMTQFADRRGLTFRNHFSGGNSSRMGMFSLFYGLPPGYWAAFSALQRSAVLVDEMQARGYQLGLYSSNTLYRPVVLDRTAFANVPDLRIVTEPASDPSWKRDRKLTGEWFDFLERRDPARPFFGFLFYDTAMKNQLPPDYPVHWPPADDSDQQRELSKYRSSVQFVDGIVAEVLADLERRGLLDQTVVLITSDHGEEFGESGAKLERHGSGYTRHQLVTPMVLAWPGRERGVAYDHRTSHYDIAPTLMQGLFGCSNPASDYSVGRNLFDLQGWDWIIAGSYWNYAVLEPDQVTVTYPNGLYEVRDWDYRLRETPVFRGDVLEAVSEQNGRFFRE